MNTLLKTLLGVAVMALVAYGVLSFLNSSPDDVLPPAGDQAQPSAEGPGAGTTVQDITVLDSGEGAAVQIRDIQGLNYEVEASSTGQSLVVSVPGVPLAVKNRIIPMPHKLIELIEAEETAQAGMRSSKITITLDQPVEHEERLIGSTLYLDIKPGMGGKENTDTARQRTPAPQPPKKVVRSAPKPRKRATPKPTPEPQPLEESASDLLAELEEDSGGGAAAAEDPLLGELENEVSPSELLVGDGAGGDDLDLGFDDVPSDTGGSEIAALPPGGFNNSDVVANLPSVQNIQISQGGAGTVIEINHAGNKLQHKKFLRRPNQLVIDLRNVTIEQLATVPSGGGSVQRVSTRQFVSADGTITRLTFELVALPQSKADVRVDNKKNRMIVELP